MAAFEHLHNILFPTDFSKSSEAIIGHVVGLAEASKAKVWILSVAPLMGDFHGVSGNYFDPLSEGALLKSQSDQELLQTDCLQRLRRLQQNHFGTVESEVCVWSAGVAESIVDYASEIKADLIMMSTHGLGRMQPFLIGAVTARVLYSSPCPVWTSPHPRELEPFHPYRHIVLAIDSCALLSDILVRASELAKFFHGQLTVLSALPPGGASGAGTVQKHTREVSAELHRQVAVKGVEASVCVMEGNPGDVVRQFAEEVEGADLIIAGHGHLKESMGYLRTHAYEIIRNAPCPVITL
jgi:nucleotide-binding universal stress UspA family protein